MKSKIKYTDEPMGRLRIIKDFLPAPEHLVAKENKVEITTALSKSSIDFFKKRSKKKSYILSEDDPAVSDSYASHYQEGA